MGVSLIPHHGSPKRMTTGARCVSKPRHGDQEEELWLLCSHFVSWTGICNFYTDMGEKINNEKKNKALTLPLARARVGASPPRLASFPLHPHFSRIPDILCNTITDVTQWRRATTAAAAGPCHSSCRRCSSCSSYPSPPPSTPSSAPSPPPPHRVVGWT